MANIGTGPARYHDPYHRIEDGLFLGNLNVALNSAKLKLLNIKRVLTVMDDSIRDAHKADDIIYYYIKAIDEPNEDLLSHFNESFAIISEGFEKNENVFVHCRAGKSRSATLTIAFLMKKYQLSFENAFVKVNTIRGVNPNPGFREQLIMYFKMNYKLNGQNCEYRRHLCKYLTHKMRSVLCSVKNLREPLYEETLNDYFRKLKEAEENHNIKRGENFRCINCDETMFNGISVIKHEKMLQNRNECEEIFIEPQQWMMSTMECDKKGTLLCYRCKRQFGQFNWDKFTCNCPVHCKISCLAFKITPKTVYRSDDTGSAVFAMPDQSSEISHD